MRIELTPKQERARAEFENFARVELAPHADEYDRSERMPAATIRELARRGYLGGILPEEVGGRGMDVITYGLLHEELGRACSSARTVITVHDMVAHTVFKWGGDALRKRWLPRLARGDTIAAFAASEPNVGSDIGSVETTAVPSNGDYVLRGTKKWISFGQIADLFLVLAQCEGKPTAFLVERDRPGLRTTPINGMLGLRASMLAEVELNGCRVPGENLVGRVGFGILTAVATGLGLGRYSVACGCVGIVQACLDACVRYTSQRQQFGVPLKEHQLIRQLVAEMMVSAKAARLLCHRAGYLKETGHPDEVTETLVAKYFAARAAMKAAADAVQIHGANGCSDAYPVQRHLRDAKVMEIIEGSNQIQQIMIAGAAYETPASRAQSSGRASVPRAGN